MSHQLPSGLEKDSETTVFTQDSLPERITWQHRTKEGAWGRIVVLDGELDDVIAGPTEPHRVAKAGPVRFRIQFYRSEPK